MSAPHLDDELLSAHLDGLDLGPEAAAHVAQCDACRSRLDALAAVAAAVGTPVAVPTGTTREAAVARALAAADAPVGGERAPRATRWLGAAAAAVVVLVGIAFVTQTGDDADNRATSLAGPAVLDGGDLGDVDAVALRERVQTVVEPDEAFSSDQSTGGGAVADAESGAGTGADSGAGGEAPKSPNAATEAAPSQLRSAQGARRTASTTACEREVARTYSKGLGPLVYRATGRWEGTAAAVLTYRVEGANGPLDHRVFVLSLADCELLATQSF